MRVPILFASDCILGLHAFLFLVAIGLDCAIYVPYLPMHECMYVRILG